MHLSLQEIRVHYFTRPSVQGSEITILCIVEKLLWYKRVSHIAKKQNTSFPPHMHSILSLALALTRDQEERALSKEFGELMPERKFQVFIIGWRGEDLVLFSPALPSRRSAHDTFYAQGPNLENSK